MGGIQYYSIFGRQVGSQYLSMAVLGTTGVGIWYSMSGEKKPKPQVNTGGGKEEEEFIQEFIKAAQAEELQGKQKH